MQEPLGERERRLRDMASEFGQDHLFSWWDELDDGERRHLLDQISTIDFALVRSMVSQLLNRSRVSRHVELEPTPIIRVPVEPAEREDARKAREFGEGLLRAGKVAPLVVAGGHGTRLGFPFPKGAFPIGPVSGKSFFSIFAERIRATQRRFGTVIPWYIMTSVANDRDTRDFFRCNAFFGMNEDQIFFFVQGTMPAVDPAGRLFMASKCDLFLNPDGHGGTIRALANTGALDHMEERGITEISYFQVDNVLARVLDPVFIGCHARAGAEMSSKVLRKDSPEEQVGVIGLRNGKLGVIEYSDLPEEDMNAKGPDGELKYWAGSIAMHMIQAAFIRRLNDSGVRLPFHRADKKVPHIDAYGNPVSPKAPNGIKFECFIFDALEYAGNSVTMEVVRKEEFSPAKNATGVASPETARRDLMEMHASWVEQAGGTVPRKPDGSLAVKLEVSPLFALDREEALKKMAPPPTVSGDLYLEG